MTYLVFHIVGYDFKDELGNLHEKTVLRLIDTSYESALERAKTIIDKPFWVLGEVVEYHNKE